MRIQVIDSHTGGEPTRVVIGGFPELPGSTMIERRDAFRAQYDHLRSAIVNEPRGSDVWVGALLTPPVTEGATVGVIFFNNVGYLGMCGHGTIGLVETLRHLGQTRPGALMLDTPVGPVEATLQESGEVEIRNVVSRRTRAGVTLDVEGVGRVTGDVAYGGNWFFLVWEPTFDLPIRDAEGLTNVTRAIKDALAEQGITGDDGAVIDHIELFGQPEGEADSRNFVLCPGDAYDRSPCGTGTSAKLACLYEDGKLKAGDWYAQESVTGSTFRGKVEPVTGGVRPTIVGTAHVTAEATLILDDRDPLRWGIRA